MAWPPPFSFFVLLMQVQFWKWDLRDWQRTLTPLLCANNTWGMALWFCVLCALLWRLQRLVFEPQVLLHEDFFALTSRYSAGLSLLAPIESPLTLHKLQTLRLSCTNNGSLGLGLDQGQGQGQGQAGQLLAWVGAQAGRAAACGPWLMAAAGGGGKKVLDATRIVRGLHEAEAKLRAFRVE